MSIKTLVEDAEHLWADGRKQGAWVQGLIAAAATARKRYPAPMADNQAFKSFIRDITHTIVTSQVGGSGPIEINFYGESRDDSRRLEDIFYEELRCNLVHEGQLKDITFSESNRVGDRLEATLCVPGEGPGELPDFWGLHLIAAVKAAPENNDLWSDAS